MAANAQVKQFLAYWFQLGKGVAIQNGREILRPHPVTSGDSYSQEFEECWQKVLSPDSGQCYLEGTSETVAELLTPEWEMMGCSRCEMPVPLRTRGMPPECCPCFDLPNWPDYENPLPRSPVKSKTYLLSLCQRLAAKVREEKESKNEECTGSCPLELLLPKETEIKSQNTEVKAS